MGLLLSLRRLPPQLCRATRRVAWRAREEFQLVGRRA